MILGACAYDARFEDCAVHCTAECPVGLTCEAEGFCRTPGATETCAAVLETFPSCVGLADNCGPTGGDDCCSAEPVPGGTFFRSYDVAGDGMYPSMSYPATVSAFRLDKYEATVGRFRKFVEAGGGTRVNPPAAGAGAHDKIAGSGWDASWDEMLAVDAMALIAVVKCDATYQTWTDTAGSNEALPINCVTWYEALAFCIWDGGYLPTEGEWNFAAAGGSEQRAYPWSSPAASLAVDCSYANFHNGTVYCVNPPNGAVNRVGNESPRGIGKWGQADLSGNVWEWTLDWYASPYDNPCIDCADLKPATARVVRGGFYGLDASTLRGAFRNGAAVPSRRGADVGMRCARSAP